MIWFIFCGKLVALLFFEVFKVLLLHFFSSKLFPVQVNFFSDWILKVIFFIEFRKRNSLWVKLWKTAVFFPF